MYVWGNNGSYFIPLNIAAAKQHGKAHYILPGQHHCCRLAYLLELCLHHMLHDTPPLKSVHLQ